MREVYTPQPPVVVPVESLEHDPARDSPRDTGFHHHSRPHVAHRAPYRPPERHVAIAVAAIGLAAYREPSGRKPGSGPGQDCIHLLSFRTRPWRPEQLVHVLVPGWFRIVGHVVVPHLHADVTR